MKRHVKASTAGSTMRRAKGLGGIFRGAFATRGASSDADGSGAPSRRLLALCIPLALLLAALVAATAQAAPETIATLGSNAGQVDLPVGTAVDQTSGDLYVAEGNSGRISKFDSEGNFLLAWGFGVRDGETAELQTCGPQATPPQNWCFGGKLFANQDAGNIQPKAVTVDQASGDVYVTDSSKRRVTKFTPDGDFLFLVGKNVNKTKVDLGEGATQAEKNICTAASGDSCKNGQSGTGANEFASPRPLAITPAGTVWIGDTNRLKSFDSSGTPGSEIALAGAGNTMSLAIDSAGDFFARSASLAGVRKLAGPSAPVPGELLETLDEAGQARTVTIDEADNVYVGDETSPYRFLKYNPAGEQVSQFGAGEVIGFPGNDFNNGNAVAVGEAVGKLYVVSSRSGASSAVQAFPLPEPGPLVEAQGVEDIEPTTATLTATINPEGEETTYRFEYGTTEAYGQSTPTETLTAEDFESEDVAAGLEELIPDTTYHFRVVATNHCNPSEPAEECVVSGGDQTFTTLPAVVIDPQWATDVTATSARLHAEMDPLGVEAEAWLEYGTDESYGQVVPLANLGEGFGPVLREHFLTGLQPGTTYHYRFVARDERDGNVYTANGAPKTFTTQLSGIGFELADSRVWEMVSPTDKHGATIVGATPGGIVQAAADGEGFVFPVIGSIEAHPQGNRAVEGSYALAGRNASGRWASEDITPPHSGPTIITRPASEFQLFSADLGSAIALPADGTLLSPQASERTIYLRENTDPPIFTPLLTSKEGYANVPPGTEFGGGNGGIRSAAYVLGASEDLSHIVLRSDVPLIAGAPANALYEWHAGQLHAVSKLPAGDGGGWYEGALGFNEAQLGSGWGSVHNAVSADGTRVFWSPGAYNEGGIGLSALYLRDTQAGETARLDLVQPGASGLGTAKPVFQGASADGTVAFFTDERQLSEGSSSDGRDLYRCEIPAGESVGGCATLIDITPSPAPGESAEVLGIASGIGEDGDTVSFVARGVLDPVPNSQGESAVAGEPNLYRWQQGGGTRFIATLSEEDRRVWGLLQDTSGTLSYGMQVTGAGSPSGRYFAFMSRRGLSDEDNLDVATEEPVQQVFVYDTQADRLRCASCGFSGERPRGRVLPDGRVSAVDPIGIWSGIRLGAILPETSATGGEGPFHPLYRPRAVLDNGRVFFNSIDSLVAADSNGQWDVYEYEPAGTGSCRPDSAGAAIASSSSGCIALISSGTGEEEAAFFDASVSGDDVFFTTPAKLSVLDEDTVVDVYDARVNGIPATLPEIDECLGEACQPAAEVPNDPTPASAAFKGAGNLVATQNCGAISRRTGKLARRAQALRRKAKRADSPKATKQLRGQAKRQARKARGLSKRAKRCRHANRRAGR